MYYSAIGLLAILILIIENQDILLKKARPENPTLKDYRYFLFSVLLYYITDAFWGLFEALKLPGLLFADTSIYYITMALGVLFWTRYVIVYMEEGTGFGRVFIYAGRVLACVIAVFNFINIFVPVMFTVDADCVYHALTVRHILLAAQIVLLLLISGYASSLIMRKDSGKRNRRYESIAFFGMIMAVFLMGQMWSPNLPLYTIGYLLGTSLLRTFVIGDEKAEYKSELKEAEKIRLLKQSITSLLDNMPALSFSKDANTGVYLACNQAFAEYAHKKDPDGVVGLTDAEIFDSVTASHFVEDDKMALSMEEPYIFFEDVPDAAGNQRQFQTTKLKFYDAVGRLCLLGMCQDVTDMVRIRRENAMTKEAYEKARSTGLIFTHIAQALARGYSDIYYINADSGDYVEYRSDEKDGGLALEMNAGLVFDTRDIEAAPNRGIWTEAYLNGNVLDHRYLKACAYFRHYIEIPIHLPAGDPVFAYRLAWQQTIAGETPFYMIQNIPLLVQRNMISEGFGSSGTIRGLRENRILTEGFAWANTELRVKIVNFKLFNQFFYIALNPFFDAGIITKPYRADQLQGIINDEGLKSFDYSAYVEFLKDPKNAAIQERFNSVHNAGYEGRIYDASRVGDIMYSGGAGLKIAMNQNFIISAEYAHCFYGPNLNANPWIGIGMNYQF